MERERRRACNAGSGGRGRELRRKRVEREKYGRDGERGNR